MKYFLKYGNNPSQTVQLCSMCVLFLCRNGSINNMHTKSKFEYKEQCAILDIAAFLFVQYHYEHTTTTYLCFIVLGVEWRMPPSRIGGDSLMQHADCNQQV